MWVGGGRASISWIVAPRIKISSAEYFDRLRSTSRETRRLFKGLSIVEQQQLKRLRKGTFSVCVYFLSSSADTSTEWGARIIITIKVWQECPTKMIKIAVKEQVREREGRVPLLLYLLVCSFVCGRPFQQRKHNTTGREGSLIKLSITCNFRRLAGGWLHDPIPISKECGMCSTKSQPAPNATD